MHMSYLKRRRTKSKYTRMFENNDFGEFNSTYGKYVKKDAEFWGKVRLGRVVSSNEAIKLRCELNEAQPTSENNFS